MNKLCFETLYAKQKAFQESMMSKEVSLPLDSPEMMHYHLSAASVEIAEILQCDERWKDWKKNPKDFLKEDKLSEFADTFLFLFNALLYSGFTGQEVYDMINKKIDINMLRQKEGY